MFGVAFLPGPEDGFVAVAASTKAGKAAFQLGGRVFDKVEDYLDAVRYRSGQSEELGAGARANLKNREGGGYIHPRTSVPHDVHGFPIFNSKADMYLPEELWGQSREVHARASTMMLRETLSNDPSLRARFSAKQLKDIEAGNPRVDGLIWHHHQDSGRMQLVDSATHGAVGHPGGFRIWGGCR